MADFICTGSKALFSLNSWYCPRTKLALRPNPLSLFVAIFSACVYILIAMEFPVFVLCILVTIEFSRLRIMYLLIRKTITSGPARNFHTRWVYSVIQKTFTLGPARNSHTQGYNPVLPGKMIPRWVCLGPCRKYPYPRGIFVWGSFFDIPDKAMSHKYFLPRLL